MDFDFNEEAIAFGKAGLDQEFTLFKCYTRELRDATTGEVGQFSLDCKYPLASFETHRDPLGLLKYLTRKWIVHCVQSKGVPYEKWVIEFSPIMERYQIPSHLFLDTQRDRAWLL